VTPPNRLDNTRSIRAPRGLTLSCKSWLTEAPLRMLMNNLDAEVAENPQELVVYGGIGRAARDWHCYDAIVAALKTLGRMAAAGLAAFAKADPKKSGIYAYERSHPKLGAAHEKKFRANKKAWTFFKGQAPWYQRTVTFWVVSAKREETRLRRLTTLIAISETERRLGLLAQLLD